MLNGTTINFRYISQRGKTSEDGQTTSNLLSATYDAVTVDQVEDPGIVEKDFFDIMGRLRGTTPYRGSDASMPLSGPRWLIVTCNPTSNWFYRKIIKPLHMYLERGIIHDDLLVNPTTRKPIVELFEGSTYENKNNLPEDFLVGLEASYTGQMRERYLMGKWAAFEGLVYPNFREEIHMMDEQDMISYLLDLSKKHVQVRAIEGYDFGIASPSCYLIGFVDNYSRVFVLDGFYKSEMSLEDQAHEMRRLRDKWANYGIKIKDPIIADPDLFKRKSSGDYKVTGTTIAGRLMDDFGIKLRPGDNAITAGIMKTSSYLNQYSHLPPINDPAERSAMIYFNGRLDFIRDEFNNYFWKRNPQGDKTDVPIDRNDHAMDTIKYMLSFRPRPGEIIIPKSEITPAYMFWHEVDDKSARRIF